MYVLYSLVQIGIFGIALWCLVDAWRKHKIVLFLFLLFDALIFESLILYLYGAVEYNSVLFSLGKIPFMVFISWAILLYSLLQVIESKSIFLKSIFIAQAMVSIDLILDKVAIVSGFWNWNDTIGFFQIPYDNFFAWFIYSFLAAYFVSVFLQKANSANILKAFIFISAAGLAFGYLWTLVPLTLQSVLWWLIFIGVFVLIFKHPNKLGYKLENIYLLFVPFAFYLFAFFLILINWAELSKYYVFISLLLFSCWLILSVRKINTMMLLNAGRR